MKNTLGSVIKSVKGFSLDFASTCTINTDAGGRLPIIRRKWMGSVWAEMRKASLIVVIAFDKRWVLLLAAKITKKAGTAKRF
jgi:hypothetical protein